MAKIDININIVNLIKKYLTSFSKSMVARFYTKSDIDKKMDTIDRRSVIGDELDYGLFTRSTDLTISTGLNTAITFDKSNGSNMTLNANGKVVLKAGKKYKIMFGARTGNLTENNGVVGGMDLGLYDYTNNKHISQVSDNHTTDPSTGYDPGLAYYTPTVDSEVCAYVTYYSSGSNVFLPSYACYMEVQEINRQIIIDPAEDAKKIQFEHGLFTNINTQNIVAGSKLQVTHQLNGNMSISSNGYIKLKSGKTYKIRSMAGDDKTYIDYMVYDVTNSKLLGMCASNSSTVVAQGMAITEYTPSVDCEITIYVRYLDSAGTGIIQGWRFFIEVEEIAQPYYFNNYKDSLGIKTIFTGDANTVTQYSLTDKVDNYFMLKVIYEVENSVGTVIQSNYDIMVDEIVYGKKYQFIMALSKIDCISHLTISFINNTTFEIDDLYLKSPDDVSFTIKRIVGFGFNYENPYKDVITSIENFSITETQIDSDINDVWNEVNR